MLHAARVADTRDAHFRSRNHLEHCDFVVASISIDLLEGYNTRQRPEPACVSGDGTTRSLTRFLQRCESRGWAGTTNNLIANCCVCCRTVTLSSSEHRCFDSHIIFHSSARSCHSLLATIFYPTSLTRFAPCTASTPPGNNCRVIIISITSSSFSSSHHHIPSHHPLEKARSAATLPRTSFASHLHCRNAAAGFAPNLHAP